MKRTTSIYLAAAIAASMLLTACGSARTPGASEQDLAVPQDDVAAALSEGYREPLIGADAVIEKTADHLTRESGAHCGNGRASGADVCLAVLLLAGDYPRHSKGCVLHHLAAACGTALRLVLHTGTDVRRPRSDRIPRGTKEVFFRQISGGVCQRRSGADDASVV